jgi:hypothetical protein
MKDSRVSLLASVRAAVGVRNVDAQWSRMH